MKRSLAIAALTLGGLFVGSAQANTVRVPVAADTTIAADSSGSSFTIGALRVDGRPRTNALLRFRIPALSGSPTRVRLLVFKRSGSSERVRVQGAACPPWRNVSWQHPPATGRVIGSTVPKRGWALFTLRTGLRAGPTCFMLSKARNTLGRVGLDARGNRHPSYLLITTNASAKKPLRPTPGLSLPPTQTADEALNVPYKSSDLFRAPGVPNPDIWNNPIPAGAPLTPNSAALGAKLAADMMLGASPTGKRWFSRYFIYNVDKSTPMKIACSRYVLAGTSWSFNQTFHNVTVADGVPVPPGALQYDGGGDHSMAILQPSSNRYWEFYKGLDPAPAGTTDPQGRPCDYLYGGGGRISDIGTLPGAPWYSGSPGYMRNNLPVEDRAWGRQAAGGVPVIGGLITPQEWNGTEPINHALSISVPAAGCAMAWWPAVRNDCIMGHEPSIQEASRIRISPAVACLGDGGDLAHQRSYWLCRAMQVYGAYVVDQTGNGLGVKFRAGGTLTPDGPNGKNLDPNAYYDLNADAWRHVQVLAVAPHVEPTPGCQC